VSKQLDDSLAFLQGGGELGELIRTKNWSNTPLGPAEHWPQSLKTTLGILLNSRYPMFLFWGPHLVKIYNDGYRPITGHKHPWALGRPGPEVWPEIWDDIKPLVDRALAGDPTWSDDLLLFMERSGFPEEVYFTFSYSPIPDESGGIGGMFCACTETTGQVVGERRLRTLRDLAAAPAEARTVTEACALSADALRGNRTDVPFALIYLLDGPGRARLVATAGTEAGRTISPSDISSDAAGSWPIIEVAEARAGQYVTGLGTRFTDVPAGPWPEPPSAAMVLPLVDRGLEGGVGALVLGLSSRRPFDDEFRGWCELVAGQVSASISNAHAAEEERKRARALAEIDRAKTAFFSNVSHEFRTPLTLMLGPTEEALASPDRALRGDALDTLYRNELRLLKLVNTLLDFSRVEADRVEASYEPTDLAALTSDLASTFRSAIERTGLRFEVACPPLARPAYVDPAMWEKIVLNLISNALKFTFDGTIRVSLEEAGESIELRVSDTGVGIPAHEQPRIFERFHRIEGTRARTHEGSGIGLALVNDLVQLHGGQIRVESAPDAGSTFIVSIPAGHAHLPPDRIGTRSARAATRIGAAPYVGEALRWHGVTGAAPAAGVEAPGAAPERPCSRVLVADDNADMRDYLVRLLTPFWDVETVDDGSTALAAARERPPDLLLADVMMTGLDGFELLRAVRAEPNLRMTPVILLSARAGEESRLEGIGAGADDYIVKPFSAQELLVRVSAHVQRGQVRRELTKQRAQLYALFEQAPAAIAVFMGKAHRIVFANARYTAMCGRSREQLLDRPLVDVFPELSRSPLVERLDHVLETGQAMHLPEFRIAWSRGGDGARNSAYFDWTCQPILDANGVPEGTAQFFFDVTEQVNTRTELDAARAAAEAASRAKDEFLAMLGHELRNPLSPIMTALQLMRLRGTIGAEHERSVIERQVRHMVSLVDDLLDVSRIARGKVQLRLERVDLADAVAKAIEMTSPAIDERRHVLEIDVQRGLVVDGDPGRLSQVVANLLSNAAKYTDAGGCIVIAANRDEEHAVLRVQDNGTGIDAEMLPRVFELFSQERQAIDRSQGGLGLGLAIVRSLVQAHGGTVSVHSAGRGSGSEFVIRLPLAARRAEQEALAAPDDAVATQDSTLRVLVVDDNADAAQLLAISLRAVGFVTEVAFDGPRAIERARTFMPDVVLLDLGLPVMDGFEVALRLKSDPELRQAKLVAVTGYGQTADRERTREMGFDGHFVKPVDLDHLENWLRAISCESEP
jgi:PAS domain S-box-containing protein